jgi:multisubunit Na+/H+ antiporter MnhB subunit
VKFIYRGTEIVNYVVAPFLFYDTCIAVGIVLSNICSIVRYTDTRMLLHECNKVAAAS